MTAGGEVVAAIVDLREPEARRYSELRWGDGLVRLAAVEPAFPWALAFESTSGARLFEGHRSLESALDTCATLSSLARDAGAGTVVLYLAASARIEQGLFSTVLSPRLERGR